MLEQMRSALAEISESYSDRRLHFCQLEVRSLEANAGVLAGSVLDDATLAGVLDGLAARFPAVSWDATAVEILRGPAPKLMTVATTLTGLHAGPSFLSELLSQLLNAAEVEVLREDGRWRFVRQADGYLGWAYQPYLAAAPRPAATHIVCEPVSLLRSAAQDDAALASRILGGTAVQVATTKGSWGLLALAGGGEGWARLADLRSLSALPVGEDERRAQIVADAARFIGAPYLWGGCTAFGVDCSGFVQMLYRLSGVTLPRDADMQCAACRPVAPPFQPADLLFFGESGGRRKITHVALSLGGRRIVHSSRSRNGVYEDDVQAVEHLRESFVAAVAFT